MVCSVWCRAAMDIGQRQPLQERSGTTSTEGTQGQASFHHGELLVVERHYRVRMQASFYYGELPVVERHYRVRMQASFYYGELPVVERHYRVRMQASHTCFSCSAIRAKGVRRRVARSGKHGTELPEQFFIDETEQEDADASLHWARGDNFARADVEGQRACQRASRLYQSTEPYDGREAVEGYD
jgi:CRISPR/Cas system-associated endoribonuclease Cas2